MTNLFLSKLKTKMKSITARLSAVLLLSLLSFSFFVFADEEPENDSPSSQVDQEDSDNDTNEALNNRLFNAIAQGDGNLVRQLINDGADLNYQLGNRGDTPLIFAVMSLHLLEKAYGQKYLSDPNTFQTAYSNRLDIVRFLVFHEDVDCEAQNNLGETALSIANQEGMGAVADLLITNLRMKSYAPKDQFAEYKEQLDLLDISPEIRLKIAEAIEKAENAGPHEAGKQLEYLKFLFSLPWDKKTEDNNSLPTIKDTLDDQHYGLKKVKDKILEFMAISLLTPKNGKTKILCLVGPPGTGKTSIAQSIAKSLGRKFTKMSLGGVHDESIIRGHNKVYIGAEPGDIVKGLKSAGSKNPVFLLDEIDKMGTENQWSGNPASALLEVLDPEQNSTFLDHYLDIPFDLSEVLFVATANSFNNIPRPLLDRVEIVELSSYTHDEKFHIGKKYLLPKAINSSGMEDKNLVISDDVLHAIIKQYTYESGVRKLEQKLKTLCGKAARIYLETNTVPTFTPANLETYLGAGYDRQTEQQFLKQNSVGIANGLYWTSIEGGVLFVETSLMPGTGKLELTGNLGISIKESANIAFSYVRSHAQELGINPDLFKQFDVHVHVVPSGGTEGPSAGTALLSSLVSAFTKKPFNGIYALTGEISLTGRVLPIGGLKEKLLAAKQNGIRKVIIPKGNSPDLHDIDDAANGLEITFAVHAKDVLEKVLLPN